MRSNLPSPLRSPRAIDEPPSPVATLVALANVPLPLPSRTATVPSLRLLTTRSGAPSPFRSPTTTMLGRSGRVSRLRTETPIATAQQNRDGVVPLVGYHYIQRS